jgi:hypothetical protein
LSARGSSPSGRARARRRALAGGVLALAVFVGAAGAAPPGKQRAVGQLTSTTRAAFRIVQFDSEVGRESYEQRVYDNNTVVFAAENEMSFAPGVVMSQKMELTLEDESRFPRSLHVVKTIAEPNGSFEHRIDVNLFANVAVVASELRGVSGSRRIVVPAGTAVQDVGALIYWYQILFWYDRAAGGRQRFRWLDPMAVQLEAGEMYLAGEDTIEVLGKKTPVTVFKVERERLGPATLHVDAQGTIVRCEQNLSVFELVEYSQRR